MATLMDYIVAQSTLPVGNTIRDHLNNPAAIGGGGGGFIYSKEPIQVGEQEILNVSESELLSVSERIILTIETDEVVLKTDELKILEVTNGEN